MLLTLHDIQAQYAPDFALLRFQWYRQNQGLAHFRSSMNAVAQLMEQDTVTSVLIDLHGLPTLGFDEQFWLAAHWLGRVSGPALRQVALVMPAGSHYNQMVVESLLRAGQHFIHYDIQFFNEPDGALDWLLHHNVTAQDALELEWTSAPIPVPDYPAR